MKRLVLLLAYAVLLAGDLPACKVPVFRFALERWPADDFRLLAVHPGPREAGMEAELVALQKALEKKPRKANLQLEIVDLARLTEAQRISTPGLETAGNKPGLVLLPPESWKSQEPVWTGALNSETLARVLDSPARQRIQQRLMEGDSAVFVIVLGSAHDPNVRVKERVAEGLARANSLLEIPEGVIRREDLNEGLENIDLDDVLRSDLPLRISFVDLTVSHDDPAEEVFLATLLGPVPPREPRPLIVPVFGRGRTPGPLPDSSLTPDRVFAACQHLAASCSCQAKQGNPGYDLLFPARWDEHLDTSVLALDRELVQGALDIKTFAPGPDDGDSEAAAQRGVQIPLLLIGVIALLIVFLGAATVLFLRKPSPTA